MYLMYVDESGDTGLVGSPTRYFALSGLVVHERDWREFLDRLLAFRRTLKSVYGLGIRTELHASEFMRSPVDGLSKIDRLAVLRNTLDEIAKLPNLSITNVIVDKQGKPDGYDVFQTAWGVLFQRFDNTLHFSNFPGKFSEDYGLVLTDATTGSKLTRLVRRMSVYNPIPSSYGGAARNIPIRKIIGSPWQGLQRLLARSNRGCVCIFLATTFFAEFLRSAEGWASIFRKAQAGAEHAC